MARNGNVVPISRERRKLSKYDKLAKRLEEIGATGAYVIASTPQGSWRIEVGQVEATLIADEVID